MKSSCSFLSPLSALLAPLAEMSEDCRFAFRIIEADNEGVGWLCAGGVTGIYRLT